MLNKNAYLFEGFDREAVFIENVPRPKRFFFSELICFLFLLENTATEKGNNLFTLIIKIQILFAFAIIRSIVFSWRCFLKINVTYNTLAVLKHLFDFSKVERYQVHNIISHTNDGSLVTETILQAPEFCFIASGLFLVFTQLVSLFLLFCICYVHLDILYIFVWRNLFS